jgi:hypothetical protein
MDGDEEGLARPYLSPLGFNVSNHRKAAEDPFDYELSGEYYDRRRRGEHGHSIGGWACPNGQRMQRQGLPKAWSSLLKEAEKGSGTASAF